MNLPTFRYHPDPIATGSIEASDKTCVCCGRQRGFIYVGPAYCEQNLVECLCPWCIADGSAHIMFKVEFTDMALVGGCLRRIQLPTSVVEEIGFRTPGFAGWQAERWMACCGDAAAFVGRAGHLELRAQWSAAVSSIQDDCGLWDGPDWEAYFRALDRDGSPTAYVFRCLHCGRYLGYSDCD